MGGGCCVGKLVRYRWRLGRWRGTFGRFLQLGCLCHLGGGEEENFEESGCGCGFSSVGNFINV